MLNEAIKFQALLYLKLLSNGRQSTRVPKKGIWTTKFRFPKTKQKVFLTLHRLLTQFTQFIFSIYHRESIFKIVSKKVYSTATEKGKFPMETSKHGRPQTFFLGRAKIFQGQEPTLCL